MAEDRKYVPLASAFARADPRRPVELVDFEANDDYVEFRLENALQTPSTERALSDYFDISGVRCLRPAGSQAVAVRIGRYQMPTCLRMSEILRFVQSNSHRGLLLGLSEHGVEYWDPARMLHAGVVGISGSGKSSFLRSLMAQSIAFRHDVVNMIVDPKGNEFQGFEGPATIVAKNRDQWYSLVDALILEIAARRALFERFEIPPADLGEYQRFRQDGRGEALPDLPRIVTWIDEYRLLQIAYHYDPHSDNFFEKIRFLLRIGRAFGVHLVISTQEISDLLGRSLLGQLQTGFAFRTSGDLHDGIFSSASIRHLPAIPGRMLAIIDDVEGRREVQCQTPLLSAEEALFVARGFSQGRKPPTNHGFLRLKLQRNALASGDLVRAILSGKDLFTACKEVASGMTYPGGSRRESFVLFDLYDVE